MAAATGTFKWFPQGLTAAVKSAMPLSVKEAAAMASALRHSKTKIGIRSGVNGDVGYIRGTGLGAVFEGGRTGGYEITPGGFAGVRSKYSRKHGVSSFSVRTLSGSSATALFMPVSDTGFRASAIGGSMRAYPFLRPAAEAWPTIYRKTATATCSGAGYHP